MNLLRIFILVTFTLTGIYQSFGWGQDSGKVIRKKILASRIEGSLKIDGYINEPQWKQASKAGGFVQYEPFNGAGPSQESEVLILYNNESVYFAAFLYDDTPDSIYVEYSKRDGVDNINSDLFSVYLMPFDDGLNAFEFKVSAAGVQGDRKISSSGSDQEWDAVWKSAVRHTSEGWIVEMEIPYAAIRFPKKDIQQWGINFWRHIRRYREWSTFNFIDKEKGSEKIQTARLEGINHIKPPLRLSFYPYISSYAEKIPGHDNISYSFNYGMDLKYGINESFTLDATLIPDFGQVQSDDEVLNLSPYEVRYQERRQFFTEGVELFTKGNIFYSRRIGQRPVGYATVYDSLNEGEVVVENPGENNLINAAKISGRTKNGLGIGLFNAMTAPAIAITEDSLGNQRNIETQGFTNYNVLVFDQNFRNNSFLSFINTNVSRKNYSANVSGTVFKLENRQNTYAASGNLMVSQKYRSHINPEFGHRYNLNFRKINGNFRWSLYHHVESDSYDPNDLGYLGVNNKFNFGATLNYNIYKPFWRVLSWYHTFNIYNNNLYQPRKFSAVGMSFNTHTTFRNHLSAGCNLFLSPFKSYDFYEPRIDGRKFAVPSNMSFSYWLSPDYRKKLAIDVRGSFRYVSDFMTLGSSISIGPRLRLNNKSMLIYSFDISHNSSEYGYANNLLDSNKIRQVIFGRRDRTTLTNTLNTSYIFSRDISLSGRLRHYWSKADFHEFYLLNEDGSLTSSDYDDNHDINFNAFTFDLVLTWQFAPGSEMSIVWKNAIYQSEDYVIGRFVDNFNHTFLEPALNSISIKVLYYFDYQYLRRWF